MANVQDKGFREVTLSGWVILSGGQPDLVLGLRGGKLERWILHLLPAGMRPKPKIPPLWKFETLGGVLREVVFRYFLRYRKPQPVIGSQSSTSKSNKTFIVVGLKVPQTKVVVQPCVRGEPYYLLPGDAGASIKNFALKAMARERLKASALLFLPGLHQTLDVPSAG
eukprot:2863472-Amphidinium_carterae.1